jgi:ribosomal protein S17E
MPLATNILQKYMNRVFVETGSHAGEGIQSALDCGFNKIISIELSEKYYNFCVNRFKSNDKVVLVQGDVEIMLEGVISRLNEPITFWLDAHYSGDDTALGMQGDPIYEELEIIKQHPIKIHTLLIDDIRGMNVDKLKEKVLEINENYQISFEDGFVPNDVLVAKI